MTFRENANISTGRAQRAGGGGRGGTGLAIGGGLGTIVLALVIMLLGGNPGAILGGGEPGQQPPQQGGTSLDECRTGADANENVDCRMKATMVSLEDYWTHTFPDAPPPTANLFTGSVNTACGQASSAVGPFYCPLDEQIYLDTSFFNQLESQLGADGGNFSQMYVLAHEYGHHIQHYTGALEASRQQGGQGADSMPVRVELQADCFAGAWAGHASTTEDSDGNLLLEEPTREDIDSALSAAAAVGDDHIQEKMQGEVTPHTWTHGSSEERMGWFMKGFESKDANQCDVLNEGSDAYQR